MFCRQDGVVVVVVKSWYSGDVLNRRGFVIVLLSSPGIVDLFDGIKCEILSNSSALRQNPKR